MRDVICGSPLSGGLVDRQGVFRFYKFYKTRSDERAALSRRRNLNRENFIPTEGGSEGGRGPREGVRMPAPQKRRVGTCAKLTTDATTASFLCHCR